MASPTEISVPQLNRLIGTPKCPMIIDVRIDEDFDADPYLIPSAVRHNFLKMDTLVPLCQGSKVVVYCQKGLKISQGAAAILRNYGIAAETLKGGQFAWKDGKLPMVPFNKIPNFNDQNHTSWVTRHRPKVDRIACPWVIRRFVDPKAQFLFVGPSEVKNVAEKFNATPFDIEDVFWSHRNGKCTFDTMIDEFELHSSAIDRLALIIVIEALIRVAKRALTTSAHWVFALGSFIGIFFLSAPYPVIILIAALYGFFGTKNTTDDISQSTPVSIPLRKTALTIMIWLLIWLTPIFLIEPITGYPILGSIGAFFSKLAVVTFGGAYAVLAYMAQDVVIQFQWLRADEMMDGLGLAETTPGPLILVTEFVGFLAAFREGGIWLGLAGAALTLWVTFIPCFLWIFVGAPYIDWISNQPRLYGALSAITAAVVGVILNLSIWFGLHTLFANVEQNQLGPLTLWIPEINSINWPVLAMAIICGFMLLRLRWNIASVLGVAAMLSWAFYQFFG